MVTYLVATSHLGANASGRWPWIIVLLAASGLAWTGWASLAGRSISHERAPLAVLILVGVLTAGGGVLMALSHNPYAVSFPAAGVFVAGIYLPARWSFPAVCLAEMAILVGALAWSAAPGGLAQSVLIPMGVWLGGLSRRQGMLRQEERAETAALAERTRIARELHDVLAHSLAGLSVQLEAARVLLASGAGTERVLEHIERAHSLSSEGLAEARRAVAALREDTPPLPERLRDLVAKHGSTATFVARGTERRLTPEAELAFFRATQEALTNVSRHAPGAEVAVELEYGAKEITLVVADHAAQGATRGATDGRRTGYGLVGMRERAALAGGTLSAGPSAEGWRVEVRVPA